MDLEKKVLEEIKTAMRAKNRVALEALRAIKSAILLEKTSGKGGEITGETEIKLLQKLVKQRKESAAIYRQQNRDELAEVEEKQAAVIEKFLPEQLSEEELEPIIKKIIDDTGATSIKEMGKVMGIASKQLAGKADNRTISVLVKKLLNG
jgi:uncharacterized protein YqeY